MLSNAGAIGLVNNLQSFQITGGTGVFLNATRSFIGTGQIRFGNGQPVGTIAISNGTINVAGVPEPRTWAMLVAGFGATGYTMRRRRTIGLAAG